MSDRCIHRTEPNATRRGNYFVFMHAYFQLVVPFILYYLLHCLIEWLLFNIKWTVFRGVGVVQNVEVRFLKGTASVREASSISALWKVWESFKKQKSKKKILSLQTHPFTYSFKDQFDTFWLPCWTDGFSKFIDILYSDVVFIFFLHFIKWTENKKE